jgi:hypothetical protein
MISSWTENQGGSSQIAEATLPQVTESKNEENEVKVL